MLRTSNNRAQQKKMMFLERNLEQLTVVQRQLVEQNSSLKKEVAIAERKLIARNERIQSLESLLQDSQEKLTAANHRYVLPFRTLFATCANTNADSRLNSQPSRSVWKLQKQARHAVLARLQVPALPSHSVVAWVQESPSHSAVEVGLFRMDPYSPSSATCRSKTVMRVTKPSERAGSSTTAGRIRTRMNDLLLSFTHRRVVGVHELDIPARRIDATTQDKSTTLRGHEGDGTTVMGTYGSERIGTCLHEIGSWSLGFLESPLLFLDAPYTIDVSNWIEFSDKTDD